MDRLLSTRWNFPITHEIVLPFFLFQQNLYIKILKDEACLILRLNFPTLLVPVYLWSATQPFYCCHATLLLTNCLLGGALRDDAENGCVAD